MLRQVSAVGIALLALFALQLNLTVLVPEAGAMDCCAVTDCCPCDDGPAEVRAQPTPAPLAPACPSDCQQCNLTCSCCHALLALTSGAPLPYGVPDHPLLQMTQATGPPPSGCPPFHPPRWSSLS